MRPGPGDLPQVPVEREAGLGRDGGADEGPGENGEEVSNQKAEDQIAERNAVENEESSDDELGCGHVLAGEEAGEMAPGLEGALLNRLAVVLVELIHACRQATEPAHRGEKSNANSAGRRRIGNFIVAGRAEGRPRDGFEGGDKVSGMG